MKTQIKQKRGNYTRDNLITPEKIYATKHLFTKYGHKNIPEILMMRLAGVTLEEIGDHFGRTRERIRQQEMLGCMMLCEMLREGYVAPAPKPEIPKELIEQRIEGIFSKRTVNALFNVSIKTIGGLIRKCEWDLLCIDGIGKKAVEDIKTYLLSVGLKLNKNK